MTDIKSPNVKIGRLKPRDRNEWTVILRESMTKLMGHEPREEE
jgi:hypothetical protein